MATAILDRRRRPLVLLWLVLPVCSFIQRHTLRSDGSALFGLTEWRDTFFSFPGTSNDRRLGAEQGPPPKEICMLPFDFSELLLQGETKQLRLYEERFLQLFDDAMTNHSGLLAMGLLADAGIVQKVPLAEIEAYNRMEGFGIFVTIRVVGRAQLIDITQQKPYMKAVCIEINDELPPNLELPNLVASNIENYMLLLSSMEHRYLQVKERGGNAARNGTHASSGDEADDKADEMRQRIKIAKLEDRFYYDNQGEDDDDDEANTDPDRRARFRHAYETALATDMQGYQVVDKTGDRTPQELNAISWAAFCTEILPDPLDCVFRIQALDTDSLFERLKLAAHMLRDKKEKLRVQMEQAGIQFRSNGEMMDDGDVAE